MNILAYHGATAVQISKYQSQNLLRGLQNTYEHVSRCNYLGATVT